MPCVKLEPDAREMDVLTSACVAFVREQVLSLSAQPAVDVEGAAELAETFREPLPERGAPIDAILSRLRPAFAKSFNAAGPGYLAFIPGGGLYAAALADYVALSLNRYVGVEKTAPALAQIERTAIEWLASVVGYPPSARGILTTGGSLSNLVAIVTARVARLGEDFLRGMVYVSDQTHQSVAKAARIAGLPAASIRTLPTDARLRLDVGALDRAVRDDRARGLSPFLVVANVGTTNTGAIDPLADVARVAVEQGLWLHADAAYGGVFRLAPSCAARMAGLELCDSIALDPHKGLFLPYGTGCLLVRDAEALRRAHASEAEYLRDVESHANANVETASFTDLSPELSREFRGLRVWLPLVLHGAAAFREALEEKLALTRVAYDALVADGRFEVLDDPQLTVVAFRLRGADDAANAELLRRVNARRKVVLSSTVLGGRFTLRICIVSFRTHEDRVRDALEAVFEEAPPA
jgi:aromatic-L-amino-acid decarboxylase